MRTVKVEISNCTECPYHTVIHDPDPNDWFCDDDVAVLCEKTELDEVNYPRWKGQYRMQPVTVACRPHRIREECNIPKWCPLLENENE